MTTFIDRPIISEVIEQHLENAAFCWSRCYQDSWNPLETRRSLQRYQQRLQANLDGLRIAGKNALPSAIEKLHRWKTIDEAFVAFSVLLQNLEQENNNSVVTAFEQIAIENPSLIDGISAAWCNLSILNLTEMQRKLLVDWWASPEATLRCTTLEFISKSPHISIIDLINTGLTDTSPEFRARLLRITGDRAIYELLPRCEFALNDQDPLCRFEASYTMVLLGKTSALPVLRDSLPLLAGNDLKRALLLWATVSDDIEFTQWLGADCLDNVQKQKMCLWGIGFRGDPTLLTYTLSWLSNKTSRLAAYIVTHITDIELENFVPEISDEKSTAEITEPEEHGLTHFCANALKEWITEYLAKHTNNQKLCRGKEFTYSNAQECLHVGTQPQRWQAALFLSNDNTLSSRSSMLDILNS